MEKSVLFGSVILLTLITAFTTIRSEMKTAIMPVQEIKTTILDTVPDKGKEDKPTKSENRKRKKKMRDAENEVKLNEVQLNQVEVDLQKMEMELEKVEFQIENKIQLKELQEKLIQIQNQMNIHNEKMLALKDMQLAQVDQALKAVDMQKINLDMQKINKEIQEAYAAKDLEHSQAITLKAMEQIKLQQPLIDSMTKFNFDLNINAGHFNDDVSAILHFLERNDVIAAKDVKDFTLNENELIVNGKKQASSLHEQLKEKYIKSKGDHIIYSNAGGSKSITIRRNDPS